MSTKPAAGQPWIADPAVAHLDLAPLVRFAHQHSEVLRLAHMLLTRAIRMLAIRVQHQKDRAARARNRSGGTMTTAIDDTRGAREVDVAALRYAPDARRRKSFDHLLATLWSACFELTGQLPRHRVGPLHAPDEGIAGGTYLCFVRTVLHAMADHIPASALNADPVMARELRLEADAIRRRDRTLGLTRQLLNRQAHR